MGRTENGCGKTGRKAGRTAWHATAVRSSRPCSYVATPAQITPDERGRIMALSSDIPALWHAEGTTNADRKEIIRCLIDRVVVHVRCDSQYVDATIHWRGGYTSQHEFIRCVYAYSQLSDLDSLMQRVGELRQDGTTCPEIAGHLNAEGFVPPRRHQGFTAMMVKRLLMRGGLMGRERWHDVSAHFSRQ